MTVKRRMVALRDRAAVTIQYEAVDQTYSGGSIRAEVPIRAAAQVEVLLLERGQRQEAVQRMQPDRYRGSVI